MLVQGVKKIGFTVVVIFLLSVIQGSVWGQDGGQPPVQPPVQPPAGGGDGSNTSPPAEVEAGDGRIDLDEPTVDIELSDDERNQGFVGASAPRIIERGFVGAASNLSGPPLAPEATFGGGVNDSVTSQAIAGGAGGQGGAQIGFSVTRRSLRAKLRPAFSSPRPLAAQVVSRFGEHLSRQPGGQSLIGQYSVSISNRTAVLSGKVKTRQEADRLVRQLRLEPGVYKIVNKLEVMN